MVDKKTSCIEQNQQGYTPLSPALWKSCCPSPELQYYSLIWYSLSTKNRWFYITPSFLYSNFLILTIYGTVFFKLKIGFQKSFVEARNKKKRNRIHFSIIWTWGALLSSKGRISFPDCTVVWFIISSLDDSCFSCRLPIKQGHTTTIRNPIVANSIPKILPIQGTTNINFRVLAFVSSILTYCSNHNTGM